MKKSTPINNLSLKHYLKPYKFLISLYILLVCILNVLVFLTTYEASKTLTYLGNETWHLALKSILFLALWAILKNLISWATRICNVYLSQKISREMKLDLADRIYQITSSSYSNTDTGTFVQRVVNDPDKLISSLDGIVDYFLQLISTIAVVVYLMFLNIYVGLVVLVGIVILTVFELVRNKLYVKNMKNATKNTDNVYSLTNEIVKSEKDVKSLNLEPNLRKLAKEKYNEETKSKLKLNLTNGSLNSVRTIIATLIVNSMLIVCLFLLKDFKITVSTAMFVFMYRMNITSLASIWGNLMQNISDLKVFSSRISSLYDTKRFPTETFGDQHLETCSGQIELKNLTFSYENENKTVLNNISLKIDSNTTVAFVGKSGSGKTTLLNLMARMLTSSQGEILIDNININDLDKESIRNNISLVNQFPYIFNMSIKDNLLMVKENTTDDEIKSALEMANLKDFVNELPDGINTIVGEGGVKLSGGQRQRLAIARALIKNSSIILFDESTSSLDNLAQEHIRKSIDSLSGKKTVVIVAHRLSTIKNADKIYFLDDGKICDEGTFDELFEKNETFRTMFLAVLKFKRNMLELLKKTEKSKNSLLN